MLRHHFFQTMEASHRFRQSAWAQQVQLRHRAYLNAYWYNPLCGAKLHCNTKTGSSSQFYHSNNFTYPKTTDNQQPKKDFRKPKTYECFGLPVSDKLYQTIFIQRRKPQNILQSVYKTTSLKEKPANTVQNKHIAQFPFSFMLSATNSKRRQ